MDAANASLTIIAILLVLFTIKVGLVAAALLMELVRPKPFPRRLEFYRTRPWKCFFFGILNVVGLIFLALLLISTEILALPGVLVLISVWALVVVGRSVVYRDLGERWFRNSDPPSRTREIIAGGIVAELAFMVPVLGALFSLVCSLRGVGAVTISMLARGAQAEDVASSEPSTQSTD